MLISHRLCRACGTGYKMTTREVGKPKSGWKSPKRRQEKKKVREFLRKMERNEEIQDKKFVSGIEHEIHFLECHLIMKKESFHWEAEEYEENLYCGAMWWDEDLQQYVEDKEKQALIPEKMKKYREDYEKDIANDEAELAKLREFHKYWTERH